MGAPLSKILITCRLGCARRAVARGSAVCDIITRDRDFDTRTRITPGEWLMVNQIAAWPWINGLHSMTNHSILHLKVHLKNVASLIIIDRRIRGCDYKKRGIILNSFEMQHIKAIQKKQFKMASFKNRYVKYRNTQNTSCALTTLLTVTLRRKHIFKKNVLEINSQSSHKLK